MYSSLVRVRIRCSSADLAQGITYITPGTTCLKTGLGILDEIRDLKDTLARELQDIVLTR